eukprot:TRINITY_DN43059_c0_g1_i1.p2 TRINITY_DN43059_c0_g1~~TRINITY_DN43059_c0_g1_i1.p2  ORF type:complete len:126 (-),score=20.72 TRINITY_DN43059_c0_g1_i1:143-520(-)
MMKRSMPQRRVLGKVGSGRKRMRHGRICRCEKGGVYTMRKKTVLVVAVILGGLLLGFGTLLTTNMGTAFIGKILVEQARTHLDAALTFQGLRGNPLRGYTIENLGLFKEGVPLVWIRQGLSLIHI